MIEIFMCIPLVDNNNYIELLITKSICIYTMKKWQNMQVGKEMTLAHLYGMPKSLFIELSWRGPGKSPPCS
jgi:hypothetical protein